MSPEDHLTGQLALILGLAMSLIPALVLGIYWGPKLWRNRGVEGERSVGVLSDGIDVSG